MDLDTRTEKALTVAAKAHKGQTYERYDLSHTKEPYICHPVRVAMRVSPALKPVALLHDVLEDTEIKVPPMFLLGAEEEALIALTKADNQTYEEYTDRIVNMKGRAGYIAFGVKRADLQDNISHLPDPPKLKSLREKYENVKDKFAL